VRFRSTLAAFCVSRLRFAPQLSGFFGNGKSTPTLRLSACGMPPWRRGLYAVGLGSHPSPPPFLKATKGVKNH
jgi:hypothetical protein